LKKEYFLYVKISENYYSIFLFFLKNWTIVDMTLILNCFYIM